jgi:hypothetical protein
MTKVLFIPADDDQPVEEREASNLKEYQALVGGLIQCVELPAWGDLWLNEEGKYQCVDEEGRVIVNRRATTLAAGNLFPGDFVAGDAFVTGHADAAGEMTDYLPVTKALFQLVS